MIALGIGFILSAFLAGLLTFLAPCTLPLVPAYLGFISGVNPEDFKDPVKKKAAQRKIFLNGAFFVLGFSIIFIIFGLLAGLIGQGLTPYRIWLTRIGGLFVIIFGLFMLGVLKLPALSKERRLKTPKWLTPGKPGTSFGIGAAFAFGWTPCVGPILGSILLLASSSNTALEGAILLTVFSLGLAVPFLLVAFGYSKAAGYIEKISKYLKWVSVIGGIFLILLGVLLISGNFSLLIQWGFQFLDFLNYGALQTHL